MNKNGHIPDVYSLHFNVLVTWTYSTGWGGGGYCIGIDIIQMHFHLYLQPNKMGLMKLKLASHRRCTYSKKRTLPGLQRTTPAKHIKSFHMSSKAKRQPTPHSSIKNHRRRQENKLLNAEENNYLEVLLMIMLKCLSVIATKLVRAMMIHQQIQKQTRAT